MKFTAREIAMLCKKHDLCNAATMDQYERMIDLADSGCHPANLAAVIYVLSDTDYTLDKIVYLVYGLIRTRTLEMMGAQLCENESAMRTWRGLNEIDEDGDIREQYERIADDAESYDFARRLFKKLGGELSFIEEGLG